jgi:inorganic pyrophosphatase
MFKKKAMEVIVETPKGSAVKYKFDEKSNRIKLLKALPTGMVFPFDFGFIPGTRGDDGDPLDVLLLSEFIAFPGCLIDCRIIGCIVVEQQKADRMIRNDRFLGIPEQSRVFQEVNTISDIPDQVIIEIEQFFVNYLKAEGKALRILNHLGFQQALELIN